MSTSAERYDSLLLKLRPRPIRSERQYKTALKQLDGLMKTPHAGKAESEMIELLSTLIEQYEESRYPVPSGDPASTLEHLIESNGLTRAQLARETGIARSVITNILARRRGVSPANAMKLAARFGVPIEVWLQPMRPTSA